MWEKFQIDTVNLVSRFVDQLLIYTAKITEWKVSTCFHIMMCKGKGCCWLSAVGHWSYSLMLQVYILNRSEHKFVRKKEVTK